ncbi:MULTISPECIES: DUF3304 domain-containing protein [Klebsiella]|jgi:Protein of unknown function (DUF3304).|uniref:DUF3304 domain-containing protein n=1 Tax=Klebsiella TaxID=570 RepID=UPI00063C0AC9|nr:MULTISPECIES: DUF3304 domain-containing protein [Klebsiella]EIW9477005.1 DUF3304 domain-containing protein [Klebsiella aerogenes]EIW9497208.1 DUF3304 domain-containing protein [Klebsiella aerogenes]EKM7511221.1 DUF3304 domain-containing protein [Klebsiella aerogenes]EKV8807125.1 DUF3304 domain-containing protein [Klebsiella aerogenes]EKW8939344.1 DUF3304 domain-containing protein [Klebsiella aerogenes]
MNLTFPRVILVALLLTVASQGALAGTIKAINHTRWAINAFSVDGQSGIDIIGPYQGGGGGCCYQVPAKWRPGMTVKVNWETGVAFASDVPDIPEPERPDTSRMSEKEYYQAWQSYSDEIQEWYKKINALGGHHSFLVSVPDYTGQETCGITVHFLPCDRAKVTTSCANYGSPGYPIKEPIKMMEPKLCPR